MADEGAHPSCQLGMFSERARCAGELPAACLWQTAGIPALGRLGGKIVNSQSLASPYPSPRAQFEGEQQGS